MAKPLNIALLGTKFMGKAHSNAWLTVEKFFSVPRSPVRHTIVGRDVAALEDFADRWVWQQWTTDWKAAVTDDEIDLVDIGTSNDVHTCLLYTSDAADDLYTV